MFLSGIHRFVVCESPVFVAEPCHLEREVWLVAGYLPNPDHWVTVGDDDKADTAQAGYMLGCTRSLGSSIINMGRGRGWEEFPAMK